MTKLCIILWIHRNMFLLGWFQWCWYFDEYSCSKRLCRWIRPDHQVRKYFCSYLILDNGEYISRSLVIPIPKSNFNSFDMKERMQTFMKFLEYRIINSWQPLYDATNTKAVYQSLFDDDINDDDVEFPYGNELIDMKVEGISDTYLDALDDYIRSEILILGRDAFPVLVKFDKRKQDASGNPIVENISNPILYTRIYELNFLDVRIEEFH